MTPPAGTVRLDAVVTVPTVNPAAVIASDAAVCARLTTSGTAACAGPDDTTNATALPGSTGSPAAGLSLMTKPAGTVALDAVVTDPTASPAATMAALAAASVELIMSGTPIEVPARTISTAARFQRSALGTESNNVTGVPAFAIGPTDC